jgi:putative transposase
MLPKFGAVRCLLHRSIKAGSKIKSVTVSREGQHWYASILLEREIQTPVSRESEPVVGIDLGVAQPVVLSTGEKYQLPKATPGDLAHQAKLQQSIAKKQKGSNNRKKAIRRLAAFKAHQARVRKDAMEKVTTAIAKNHGVVAMEDLRIKSMTASAAGTIEEPGKNVAQKAGLNRSMLDVNLGAFRVRLGHKLAFSGGMQLLVPPQRTSQRCCKCGHISADNRPTRDLFACVKCGHTDDADDNASQNIRERALGVWGDADKVEVAASLAMLLTQQAKPKRTFRKKTTGGLPVAACRTRGGIFHLGQSRKRVAATQPSRANALQEARSL